MKGAIEISRSSTGAANPVDGRGTTNPPIPHNVTQIPLVTRGPYDFHKIDRLFDTDLGGDGHGALASPPPSPAPSAAPADASTTAGES